jgi:lipopolysaccharide transport system permease protein
VTPLPIAVNPHAAQPTSLNAAALSFWRHRQLIWQMTRREVQGRYRGSVLGLLWSFFNPLFMLAVYTFVFSVVFKARWNSGNDSKTEFALVLFAGLIVFNLFADCINRAPGSIISNVNYVKKVVFPLEILPMVSLGSALFHGGISLLVWAVAYLAFFGVPHASVVFLPLILLPLLLLIMGISWFLASLGVYLRDVSQITSIAMTVLMFLSPIFFPASALPPKYQTFLYFNPLTIIIEQTRDVLYWGKAPDFSALGIYLMASLAVAAAGFAWFQKTRKGFADVI